MYCPKWLFLIPGIILAITGLIGSFLLICGQLNIGTIIFSIHTLLYCNMALIVGANIIYFYVFTKLYASQSKFIPDDSAINHLLRVSEEKGMIIGLNGIVIGIAVAIFAVTKWKATGFNELDAERIMRLAIPSATLIELGIETVFASFFIGILKIRRKEDHG